MHCMHGASPLPTWWCRDVLAGAQRADVADSGVVERVC
jgi:hypothetical protein